MKSIVKSIYLELSDKIRQARVLGYLFFFY